MSTITIDCPAIKKAISPIFKVVNRTTVLPVLECVRLTVNDSKLRISATDLQNTNTFIQDIDSEEEIDVLINASFLNNFIQNAIAKDLTISFNNDIATFRNEGMTVKHRMSPISEYVKEPIFEPKQAATIDANDLLVHIENGKRFISSDDLRPAMTGMYIHEENGELKIAATDAHRLYYNSCFKDDALKDVKAILPPKCLMLLNQFKNQQVNIAFSDLHVKITSSSYELTSRLIDAKYPEYTQVIPKDNNYSFAVNRKQLVSFLKIAQLFVNAITNQIVISISGECARIEGGNNDFDESIFDYSLPIYNPSEADAKFEFAVNAKFFADGLRINQKDEYVSISHSKSSAKAMLIDDCYLLMPLMLNR